MRTLLADMGTDVQRVWEWWIGELRSLLPAALKRYENSCNADFSIVVESGIITDIIPAPDPAALESNFLDEIRRRAGCGSRKVNILLPSSECLSRRMSIPKAALPDIDAIAALDLERTTPLRLTDVYTALAIERPARGQNGVSATQFIIKRQKIEHIRALLEDVGARLVGASCFQSDPKSALPINFLSEREPAVSQARRSLLPGPGLLAALGGVLTLSGLIISIYRHDQALAALREETAALRERISLARQEQTSGSAAAQQALLQFKNGRPVTVALLEDLTRRLPDSAWVTDFRMSEDKIELGGFGRPVRSLAPDLEASEFVESAAITAPIVTDDRLQKERFELRLRLAPRPLNEVVSGQPSNASAEIREGVP
ncbi:MAG: PilN domain-containing protein [Hyphomicrobium sp.]|nr:PilN domain-containing protein [Hyphomicrobium sp.]